MTLSGAIRIIQIFNKTRQLPIDQRISEQDRKIHIWYLTGFETLFNRYMLANTQNNNNITFYLYSALKSTQRHKGKTKNKSTNNINDIIHNSKKRNKNMHKRHHRLKTDLYKGSAVLKVASNAESLRCCGRGRGSSGEGPVPPGGN